MITCVRLKNDRMNVLNTHTKRWLHKISIVKSENTPQSTYPYTCKKYHIKSIEKKYKNPEYNELSNMWEQEMITTVSYDSGNKKIKIRRKIDVKKYKTIIEKWQTITVTKINKNT